MLHAALAAKTEIQFRTVDLDVLHAQRCQAIGTVFARILIVADTDQGFVQQLHDRGENLAPAQFRRAQVPFGTLPDGRQHFAEFQHVPKFRLIARIAIARMVTVLFPAPGIARRGLYMTVGIRRDPHISPCRRNDECIDPAPLLRIRDPFPVRLEKNPSLAGPAAGDAGHAVRHIVKSGTAGCLAMLYGARRGNRKFAPGLRWRTRYANFCIDSKYEGVTLGATTLAAGWRSTDQAGQVVR